MTKGTDYLIQIVCHRGKYLVSPPLDGVIDGAVRDGVVRPFEDLLKCDDHYVTISRW